MVTFRDEIFIINGDEMVSEQNSETYTRQISDK